MQVQIPYIDMSVKHDISKFYDHELQKYMALFISKSELYIDVLKLQPNAKQDYFFQKFRTFLMKYYVIRESEFDLSNYFNSQHISSAGAVNIAGGGGSRSNSGRKALLDRYHNAQKYTKDVIDYFRRKYCVDISGENDKRLFIGHKMPWINPSPDLLEKEDWKWVVECSYCDDTFVTPIPDNIDLQLVPLKIRNKVSQLHKKKTQKNNTIISKPEDEDEEEKEYMRTHKVAQKEDTIQQLKMDESLQKELQELEDFW